MKGAQEPLSLCAHGKQGTTAELLAVWVGLIHLTTGSSGSSDLWLPSPLILVVEPLTRVASKFTLCCEGGSGCGFISKMFPDGSI